MAVTGGFIDGVFLLECKIETTPQIVETMSGPAAFPGSIVKDCTCTLVNNKPTDIIWRRGTKTTRPTVVYITDYTFDRRTFEFVPTGDTMTAGELADNLANIQKVLRTPVDVRPHLIYGAATNTSPNDTDTIVGDKINHLYVRWYSSNELKAITEYNNKD